MQPPATQGLGRSVLCLKLGGSARPRQTADLDHAPRIEQLSTKTHGVWVRHGYKGLHRPYCKPIWACLLFEGTSTLFGLVYRETKRKPTILAAPTLKYTSHPDEARLSPTT